MTATVDGVLEHNKQIRDNMLKYNIGTWIIIVDYQI